MGQIQFKNPVKESGDFCVIILATALSVKHGKDAVAILHYRFLRVYSVASLRLQFLQRSP